MNIPIGEAPFSINDGVHAVAAVISAAAGNELTSLAMGALLDNAALPSDSLYTRMYPHEVISEHPAQFRKLAPSRLGGIAVDIGLPFVETERDKAGSVFLRRTEFGTFASSVGGHLLKLSCDTSIPTRLLVGEPHIRRDQEGCIVSSSIANRTGILTQMLLEARSWQPGTELVPHIAEKLEAGEVMIRKQLERLVEARLAERKKQHGPNGYPTVYYRLKPPKGLVDPADAITRYLDIVRRFASGDTNVVNEGHEHMERILGDEKRVPYLVQRSLINSGHTGKKTTRTKLQLVRSDAA